MFYLLDPEKWERQKHFEYYMQMIPCGYTVTVRLDVENLYQQVKKCGLKFYPAFIYCTGKVVNEKREFKMGVNQEGNIQRCQRTQRKRRAAVKLFLYLLCAMDGFHRLQHMGANWKTKSISDHYIWKICGRRGQKKAVCCFDDISCIRRWISC